MRIIYSQFTIRRMMEVVAVVAVALWLLRFSADDWSIVVTSLTLGGLGVAVLGARFHRGRVRAFCAGVALSGLAYFYCFASPTLAGGSAQPYRRMTQSLITIPVAAAGGSAAGVCYGYSKRLLTGSCRAESVDGGEPSGRTPPPSGRS
jgi:hypothetical protein